MKSFSIQLNRRRHAVGAIFQIVVIVAVVGPSLKKKNE